MSITSSVVSTDLDLGYARFIEERHTDSVGNVYIVRYQCPVGFDTAARLAERAVDLAQQLAQAEFEQQVQT
jgi:hypothetical protein